MKGYGFPSEGESTQAKPPRILLKTILEQVVSAWAMELPFLCRGVLGPACGDPLNFGSLRRLPSALRCLCTHLRIVPLRPWKLGPFADFGSPSGSFSSLALLKIRKEPLRQSTCVRICCEASAKPAGSWEGPCLENLRIQMGMSMLAPCLGVPGTT